MQVTSKISSKSQIGGPLSMILPVYIRTKQSHKEELVYAMLDTQSDASFVTSDITKKLTSKGTKELITLSTLTETKSIRTTKHAFSVRGYSATEWLSLDAYEQESILLRTPRNLSI